MWTFAPGGGTGALRAVAFGLAVVTGTYGTSLALCTGGACSAPGGGSLATDCLLEYDGVTLNDPATRPRGLVCTDGDPTCDADATPNGACNFKIAACLNNPDGRFPACTAPSVASVTVKNRPPSSPSYNADLAALQSSIQALLPTSSNACTGEQNVSVPLRMRSGVYRPNTVKIRSIALSSSGAKDSDRVKLKCLPSTAASGPSATFARAELVTVPGQLIEGPLAFGRLGDFRLYNDKIQLIIQQPGRKAAAIDTYGGNIIDADRERPDNHERDNFGAWAPGINIENTAHYTNVVVLNDGTNGQPAVIRATGPDDLLDFINPSSVVRNFTPNFPVNADDNDLTIDVQTDYILEPGKEYVRVETTITNTSANDYTQPNTKLFFAEYLNGSGQVDLWQPSYGFGEALLTTQDSSAAYVPCNNPSTSNQCDPQDMVAYVGIDNANGLSYGYVYAEKNGTTAFTTSGVTVPLLGTEGIFALLGAASGNFPLAPMGQPGDSFTVTRYFLVADGGVAALQKIRNDILGIQTGTLTGTVTSGGQGVANVDVAVTHAPQGGLFGAPSPSSYSHTRTAADGSYSVPLPTGSYTVQVDKMGRLTATPASAPITITNGTTTTQDFTIPAAGAIHVTVTDENDAPIAAKVQLVGQDGSPDLRASQNILNVVRNNTAPFRELYEDGVQQGIVNVTFADKNGDAGVLEIEPGTYQLVVSHGPRYSAFEQNVTITAGAMTTVAAQIAKVVQTPGFILGDFHVHGILSPDSEVTQTERVATQLAEGNDFFTPSEHEIRSDYTPFIDALGAHDLIATAPSAEITTFDYGHFNSWPVTVDPSQVNGGTVDWGRAGVPPGQDFPSYGNYNLTPAEIYVAAHADPKANLVQINHMRSHFNTDGLDIDTATTPPQSHTPGSQRRLDPSIPNYFDAGFDALEVWIGTDGRTGDQQHFVGENLGDWFNMLNQGIVATGVADSDTHERRTTELNAHTLVASSVTDPALLWPEAENLARSIVMGHALGTNAPFLTVTVTTPLGTAGLTTGASTMIATNDGTATVDVSVKSPLWAEFDKVEFYVNNAPQAYDHDNNPATRMRYRAIPNATVPVSPTLVDDYPAIPGAKHWEATAQLNLTGLTQDAWVVVLVRGTDNVSHPLFPVIPNSLVAKACSNDPCRACSANADCQSGGTCTVSNQTLGELTDGNLNQCGVLTLAYSNPLFIDVNQNNQYDPPGVMLTP